jgi:hypothetical protein
VKVTIPSIDRARYGSSEYGSEKRLLASGSAITSDEDKLTTAFFVLRPNLLIPLST